MDTKQQELLERLKNALTTISANPETASEVAMLLEDFVITFEEIAEDLRVTSDKETAATLKAIVSAAFDSNDTVVATE